MPYEKFSHKLKTISGITITPFLEDSKEINWSGVTENVEFLLEHGVEVIVPCGNTSEFYSLTLEEAKAEIQKVVEVVNGRAIVMAGIGYSADTAIELGTHAKNMGADCVMIHQPIHPYITEEGAVSYFKKVIDAIDLPAVVYFKDANLSDNILKQLTHLDKLVGVKYAINDLPRFTKIVRETPADHHITWICGTAEKWAPYFWNSGATGFTSGLVNIYPQKSFELLHALKGGHWEKVWSVWEDVSPFEELRAKYNNGNNVVVIKEAMEMIGLIAGVTREPVGPLNAEDQSAVKKLIEGWNKKGQ